MLRLVLALLPAVFAVPVTQLPGWDDQVGSTLQAWTYSDYGAIQLTGANKTPQNCADHYIAHGSGTTLGGGPGKCDAHLVQWEEGNGMCRCIAYDANYPLGIPAENVGASFGFQYGGMYVYAIDGYGLRLHTGPG